MKTIRQTFIRLILAFSLIAPAPLYAQSHADTLTKAEAGDMFAQFQLGLDYDLGQQGLKTDKAKAAYWFQQSADSGLPWAYGRLSQMYAIGEGVEKNAALSEHYRELAEKNLTNGILQPEQHAPSEAYIQTLIQDQNRELMARAERGDPDAQKEIGTAYENGSDGFEQSDLQALEWYKKAAAQGDSYAIGSVGLLLLIGDIGLPPEDARDAALEWQKQHTGTDVIWRLSVDIQNLTPATLNAMRLNRQLYKALSALSCEADFITTCSAEIRKSALLTIKSIAETDKTGITGAPTLWGELLFKPDIMALIDMEVDPETGRAYLLKGAETGDVKALVALGRVYEHGRGVPIDRNQAINWYDRYVEQTKALKSQAETKGEVISFEDEWLVQCKLHFLRGDALRADTQFECERNRFWILAN